MSLNRPMNTDIQEYRKVYNELKVILEGCDTIVDAIPFGNMYAEKYPIMRSMIFSQINGASYYDNVDQKSKQDMLRDIHRQETKEDARDLVAKIDNRTHDDVYKRTMNRLANRKNHKIVERTDNIKRVINISKKCPHCNHVMNMPEQTTYVVCGYSNTTSGYDWNGCGKDWCFHCEKILCKSWEVNGLHFDMNRHHTDDCCKKHSIETKRKYPDDYCQCNNLNVHRESHDVLKNLMG